ncbi:MAG: LPS export ABC transporter periplasmic protein LptC [Deltaproteobacteria bacterium]|nr:LPS export ABC transporter periplasmic protein LptC [Deltaproteobacteria bacterium]
MTGFQFMKNKKAIIIGSVVFLVLAAVVFLVLRAEYSSEDNRIKILSDNVDLQVRDVLYTDVADTGLKWEIIADTAKYMKSENLAVFDNLKIKVIMQDGKTFVMTGKSGRMNTETKNIEISGNVTIVSDRGDRLTTDILKYSGSEKRFYTDSPVVMENARMQVRGTGMTLSLNDQGVSLLSKVKARIHKNDR